MQRRHIFLGHVAVVLACTTAGLWLATQEVAAAFGYAPVLGKPLLHIGDRAIYLPWAWLQWAVPFESHAPWAFERASTITYASVFVAFALAVVLAVLRTRRAPDKGAFGTAGWATEAELKRGGLLGEEGVVLCQTEEATYRSHSDGTEARWTLKRPGRLVRHDGPEHVFVFAPTRSGKGIGIVIPTLLAWRHSVLIYDIKKELWSATAGWRRKFSRCLRFEPTASDSVRFNPLMEIRRGDNEVRDAQNVADILVDPEGKGDTRDHWRLSGHALLVATILHVLYAEKDKSLAGVAAFLKDPDRRQFDTLERMRTFHHFKAGPHEVVAQTARAMLNKSANELSGVVSTALSFLELYSDPLIARNTRVSDFRISDLVHHRHPLSLYLVVPPSDIDRTRPLVRLMLNQIGRRLTERMDFAGHDHRHRLLMLLDEFPSLGRLAFFETELAYLAGYKIKCLMIAQSLNQIENAYGQNNAILDNAHIRLTYAALDERTARRISDLVGQSTQTRHQMGFSGSRLGPWLGHISENEQEYARPLLTPDEILRLPYDEALVLVGGQNPYRGKKLMYYLDARFKDRAWLPAPDGHQDQAKELPRSSRNRDWDRPPPPQPPPVAKVEATDDDVAMEDTLAATTDPEVAVLHPKAWSGLNATKEPERSEPSLNAETPL